MKKKYIFGFLFAFVATLTVFILISGIKGFTSSIQSFLGYNYLFLFLGLFIITIKWIIESLIIKFLLNRMSFKHSLKFTLIGQFYSYLTPFYTGGQPFQILYISKYGIDPGQATAMILFKTFIFQINMAFLGLIAVIYSIYHFSYGVTLGITLGILLNSLAIFLILFYVINQKAAINTTLFFVKFLKKVGLLKNPEKHIDEIIFKVKTFIDVFKMESRKVLKIVLIFILSVIQFSCSFLVLPVILKGFGKDLTLKIVFKSLITQVTSSIIPTPGTSGGAESIFYLLFSDILTPERVSSTIVLWRLTTYYYVLLIGGIVVLLNHKYKKS
ncbi:lysylphosphatidylglycerol synthase transmembrane domain-containing protein [Marinitoga lauensis]|uniref:lysylphosphatidylglycerol synthase transmembrane domain-containing protein n=1 Tax=Marinitoga lauensis TaxID=2201189 RepID=UPI001012BB83|nr:lysylphosphatidylglycerol synthase transmembrane domain-containing protein [Marinitoga lauensis]